MPESISSLYYMVNDIFNRYPEQKHQLGVILTHISELAPEYFYSICELLHTNRISYLDLVNVWKTSSEISSRPRDSVDSIINMLSGRLLIHPSQLYRYNHERENIFDLITSNTEPYVGIVSTISVDHRKYDKYFTLSRIPDVLPMDMRSNTFSSFIGNLISSGYPSTIRKANPFGNLALPIVAYTLHDRVNANNITGQRFLESVSGKASKFTWVIGNDNIRSSRNSEPLKATSNFACTPEINVSDPTKSYLIALSFKINSRSGFPIAKIDDVSLILSNLLISTTRNPVYKILQRTLMAFDWPGEINCTVFLHVVNQRVTYVRVGPSGRAHQYTKETIEPESRPLIDIPFVLGDPAVIGYDGDINISSLFIWNTEDFNCTETEHISIFSKWLYEKVFTSIPEWYTNHVTYDYEIQHQESIILNGITTLPGKYGIGGKTVNVPVAVDINNFSLCIDGLAINSGNEAVVISCAHNPNMFSIRVVSNTEINVWYRDVVYNIVNISPGSKFILSKHQDSEALNFGFYSMVMDEPVLQKTSIPTSKNPYICDLVLFGNAATTNAFSCAFNTLKLYLNRLIEPTIEAILQGD
jgi:hypothetical protein